MYNTPAAHHIGATEVWISSPPAEMNVSKRKATQIHHNLNIILQVTLIFGLLVTYLWYLCRSN